MNNMTINKLPAPTWTWLRVNEKNIEIPSEVVRAEITESQEQLILLQLHLEISSWELVISLENILMPLKLVGIHIRLEQE